MTWFRRLIQKVMMFFRRWTNQKQLVKGEQKMIEEQQPEPQPVPKPVSFVEKKASLRAELSNLKTLWKTTPKSQEAERESLKARYHKISAELRNHLAHGNKKVAKSE